MQIYKAIYKHQTLGAAVLSETGAPSATGATPSEQVQNHVGADVG